MAIKEDIEDIEDIQIKKEVTVQELRELQKKLFIEQGSLMGEAR